MGICKNKVTKRAFQARQQKRSQKDIDAFLLEQGRALALEAIDHMEERGAITPAKAKEMREFYKRQP
jgi:hypothetical protein